MDEFLILGQWGGRRTTAQEVARAIARIAEAASGSTSGWTDLKKSRPLAGAPDELVEWVEGTRSRDSDGTVFPDDGFWPSMITGDLWTPADRSPAVATVALNAGRMGGNERVAANSVTVSLTPAWLDAHDDDLCARVVRTIAEVLLPAWVSAYDHGLVAAAGRRIARPRIGYVTYLSDATIERLAGAEAYRVSTLPRGVLLELPRPWTVDVGARAAAALESASSLRPVPAVEPATS